MNNEDLCFLSAGQLSRLIQTKEISPVEIIRAYLERISTLEPILNSFITVLADQAQTAARKAEQEINSGKYKGPMHGIPFGLKDLFHVRGVRNTAGAKALEGFVPLMDGTVAARLHACGAILVGKLNMNPLAYGPIGDNQDYDYGHMHNPWNPELISGGSSGGSGSAVSSGQLPLAFGSDTGGSVRIPSALCGIVGLKPTYGRVSRHGFTTLSSSLDHPGPMARTVEDCALAMNVISGHDPHDPTSARVPVPDYTQALQGDIHGLRVGVPREYFEVFLEPHIERVVRSALETLKDLGAVIKEVSWPMYPYYETINTVILMAEAAASYRRLICEKGNQLYLPLRLRLEAGLFISAADYLQAQQSRSLFNQQCRELLEKVDLLAGPTVPVTACRIGATEVSTGEKTMGVIAALTQYASAYNLNGYPAITLPCGFSEDGLPIGLQMAGRPFDETTVLRAGHAYEGATEWHLRRPPL